MRNSNRRITCLISLTSLFPLFPHVHGQDAEGMKGAGAFLEAVAPVKAALVPPDDNDAGRDGKARVRELQDRWDVLIQQSEPVTEMDWLGLFERYVQTSTEATQLDWTVWKNHASYAYDLTDQLPSPPAWPTLSATLIAHAEAPGAEEDEAKSRQWVGLLGQFLAGDRDAFWAHWEAHYAAVLAEEIDEDDYQAQSLRQLYTQLDSQFREMLSLRGSAASDFSKTLTRWESDREEMAHEYLELPDLSSLEPEQAKALAERFLTLKVPENRVSLGRGEGTEFIARTIVENPELALVPYADLVQGESAPALWEIYQTKIPGRLEQARETDASTWQNAFGHVLAQRLLASEDIEANLAELENNQPEEKDEEAWYPNEIDYTLQRAKRHDLLFMWYQALALRIPNAVDWGDFVDLGVEKGESEAVLELMRSQLAEGADDVKVDAETRSELLAVLAGAALAADDVEAGVDYLNRQVALIKEQLGTLDPEKKSDAKTIVDQRQTLHRLGEKLVALGKLLVRDDLTTAGADLQRALFDQVFAEPKTEHDYTYSRFVNQAVDFYMEFDGAQAAESFLLGRIAPALEAAEALRVERNYPGYNPWRNLSDLQTQLAELYAKTDRHGDLIRVFREGPFWSYPSFSKVADRDADLVLSLVQALEATGEKALAEKIVVALLSAGKLTNDDAAYATLSRLQTGDALIATLDQLFANDAFQERPLIWKGRALLNLGRLELAEEALQKAISIDPSDGEQGKGDRMRVYEVLSDVHAAKGSLDEAKFFAEVVKSIRLSEDADDVYTAGLKSRGIAQYEEALTHFSDAYCIQSRMAVQLTNLGRFKEAEAFYKKAFELMPDSFGRMESHCFGCEGAFSGERAQKIAEQVFTSMIRQRPDKPQVRYLLGYLRDSQGRKEEAQARYQEAVELDPDYLNAWKKILGASADDPALAESHQRALLALARLDPFGRHTSLSTQRVFDLAALYEVLPKDLGASTVPSSLFRLAGTDQFLEQLATYQFETTKEVYPGMTREDIMNRLNPSPPPSSAPFEKIVEGHQFLDSWWSVFSTRMRSN